MKKPKADSLTTREAAEYLGFSHKTLELWRLQDRGPRYYRHGYQRVRYDRSDLDRWKSETKG